MKGASIAPCTLLVLLVEGAQESKTAAVTCNPMALSACADAITFSQPPTPTCCNKLKEQGPCLCQYIKDPNLQTLINSPNANKVTATCGSPFPTC
ncbi:hypothetical protein NMG60_11020530 [Bertholletia excelsa]